MFRESTTTKHIADKLAEKGERAVNIDEGSRNHSADYEFDASPKGRDFI